MTVTLSRIKFRPGDSWEETFQWLKPDQTPVDSNGWECRVRLSHTQRSDQKFTFTSAANPTVVSIDRTTTTVKITLSDNDTEKFSEGLVLMSVSWYDSLERDVPWFDVEMIAERLV